MIVWQTAVARVRRVVFGPGDVAEVRALLTQAPAVRGVDWSSPAVQGLLDAADMWDDDDANDDAEHAARTALSAVGVAVDPFGLRCALADLADARARRADLESGRGDPLACFDGEFRGPGAVEAAVAEVDRREFDVVRRLLGGAA
jgi:hypothetical protein